MTTIADIKKMNRFEAADLLTSMADMRDDETEEYFKNCDDYREICDEAQSDPSPKWFDDEYDTESGHIAVAITLNDGNVIWLPCDSSDDTWKVASETKAVAKSSRRIVPVAVKVQLPCGLWFLPEEGLHRWRDTSGPAAGTSDIVCHHVTDVPADVSDDDVLRLAQQVIWWNSDTVPFAALRPGAII